MEYYKTVVIRVEKVSGQPKYDGGSGISTYNSEDYLFVHYLLIGPNKYHRLAPAAIFTAKQFQALDALRAMHHKEEASS